MARGLHGAMCIRLGRQRWRVKTAAGQINGRAYDTPTISPKETDCAHSANGRVYVVNVGGKLVNVCEQCYARLQRGEDVYIQRRR